MINSFKRCNTLLKQMLLLSTAFSYAAYALSLRHEKWFPQEILHLLVSRKKKDCVRMLYCLEYPRYPK